jgi:hypothetical protein
MEDGKGAGEWKMENGRWKSERRGMRSAGRGKKAKREDRVLERVGEG